MRPESPRETCPALFISRGQQIFAMHICQGQLVTSPVMAAAQEVESLYLGLNEARAYAARSFDLCLTSALMQGHRAQRLGASRNCTGFLQVLNFAGQVELR